MMHTLFVSTSANLQIKNRIVPIRDHELWRLQRPQSHEWTVECRMGVHTQSGTGIDTMHAPQAFPCVQRRMELPQV